jgi:hypothetical protein
LLPVLQRHGLLSFPERANRLVRHIERKRLNNPGGYLEKILQRNPDFDPEDEEQETQDRQTDNNQTDRQRGPEATGEILRRLGYVAPGGQEER